MYSTASFTRVIFSASSSGISRPNSSSNAMTSSTVSSESAPRSSTNDASGVTSSSSTPSCSTMMLFTLSATAIQTPPVGVGQVKSQRLPFDLSPANSHVHAAVYGEYLPCNIRRLIGGEKAHSRRHIARRAETSKGNRRCPVGLRLVGDRLRHVGLDEPRRDDVHRDVARRHFARHRLAEPD